MGLVPSEGYDEEAVPCARVLCDSNTWASSEELGCHKNEPRPLLDEPDLTGLEWEPALVPAL